MTFLHLSRSSIWRMGDVRQVAKRQKVKKKPTQKSAFLLQYVDAHYLDNMFHGVNENQTSSPLADASLIIFFLSGH